MSKEKYTVLSALRLDGKDYPEGKSVDLEAEAAEPLLESGVVEPAPAKAATKTAAK